MISAAPSACWLMRRSGNDGTRRWTRHKRLAMKISLWNNSLRRAKHARVFSYAFYLCLYAAARNRLLCLSKNSRTESGLCPVNRST